MVVNIGLVMTHEGIQLRYCIIAPVWVKFEFRRLWNSVG
jgi:hypothetical protein